MYLSVFTDEFHKEVTTTLSTFAEWGFEYVDFRSLIYGQPIESLTTDQLKDLKRLLDSYGLKTGVIQSSLCKVHLPDSDVVKAEMKKLDGILRASEILNCNLVRSFNFWQHDMNDPRCGDLAMRPDELSKVLVLFEPFAKRARDAGLILGFENCGQTPDEVIAFLEAINIPEWGMAWDVSNMFEILPEAQGDCVEYFSKALKYANMLHVKCRGVLQEVEGKKVPWDRVLRGVAVTRRNMPISIETHLPSGVNMTAEEATKRCYEYIKKVWPTEAPGDMKTALEAKPRFSRPYEDNPVRMVVVGLGMGKTRCAQIAETSGIKLVGVCDINLQKAQAVGEQFQVPYSDDINVFLSNPEVEVMYIVTPTGLHCSLAEQCLNAGKHVLLTKPMDVNTENCDRAIRLAQEKGLLLGCDFDLHFRGPLEELKCAVANGFFGKIKSANIILNIRRTEEYFKENGGWRGTWAMDGGGSLSNQGIHEIDRLMSVFGKPVRVSCFTARQTYDIEAEDYGMALWQYENGMIARISSTTSYPVPTWYTRLEVYGESGAYLLTAGGPEGDHIYWWKDQKWVEDAPYPVKRQWQQASDNFAYCLRMGEKLVVDAYEGRDSRYILDKMYESAQNGGKWVDI